MQKNYIGTLYTGVSDAFQAGLCPIARCLKAEKHDLAAVEIIKLTERIDMKNDFGKIAKQASKQVEVIGCMDNTMDNTFESANRVYGTDGLSPTINTCGGGGLQPKIVEVQKVDVNELGFIEHGTGAHKQQIIAMRGRNPDNPSDRTPGAHLEQRLEPNEQGICNCLTSVSKDNMVLEKKSIKIRQATKDGFIDCEIGGVADLDYPSSETRRGRVINKGQISPTLTTENIPSVIELGNPDFYNFLYEIDGDIYLIRIRKLNPKECWKLMDFSDEDFEKAAAVNSNTQLYKQAGNSIVKNVLVAIMGQLFEGKEDVYRTV